MNTPTPPKHIVLASVGRFHYARLASSLHRHDLLTRFYSGFTRSHLRCPDIPANLIDTWPWLQMPVGAAERYGLLKGRPLRALTTRAQIGLDHHITRTLPDCDVFAALSGCAVGAGAEAVRRGIRFVCERSSEHIRTAEERIAAEFDAWGISHLGTDPRMIEREEHEYDLADRIVLPSDFAYRSFLRAGIPADKLSITPLDIDTTFTTNSSTQLKKRHGLNLLFVGAQSIIKGFGHLLRAFARAGLRDAHLRVIGQPVAETAELLGQTSSQRVEFLGYRKPVEVARAMREADALIVPSISDGGPTVVYEALQSGCPVVVSDCAGASMHIHDGVNGLVVPAGDSDALTDVLRRLQDDIELIDRLRTGIARLGPMWQLDGDYAQRWLRSVS